MNTRYPLCIVFILLLLNSFIQKSYACYFYPYGEDIRMSLFYPNSFNFHSYERFNYCYTYEYPSTNHYKESENVSLWFNYCKQKVSKKDIDNALEELDFINKKQYEKHPLICYLKAIGDQNALDYLSFAKAIEHLNPDADDVWEHNQDVEQKKREVFIQYGLDRIKKVTNVQLVKRYYFQVFRLLKDNKANKRVIQLYDEVYSKRFSMNGIIDNWILFYRMSVEPNDVKMNFFAAQLFALETDNRFDIRWYFNRHIPIKNVLAHAKTKKEKANILALYTIRKLDYSFNAIQTIYSIHPQNEALEFLLLREINKIEDWVLTPSYAMFQPVLREDYWENNNSQRILHRAEVDRKYAEKVLQWVERVDLKKVKTPNFWRLSKAYLEFLVGKPLNTLQSLAEMNVDNEKSEFKEQYYRIFALSKIAHQSPNLAQLPSSIQKIILKNKDNGRFLFALAKELEFNGNKSEAALLISKIVDTNDDWENNVYWRSGSGKKTLWDDFNFNWYHYVDAELSAADWELVITQLKTPSKNSFEIWLYSTLKNDSNRVYDLLGIKYMRDNDLAKAYTAFKKVAKGYYTNNPLFNENPFYKIKGYMNFDEKMSATNLTKASVVRKMIQLQKAAQQVSNKNRHKDYFLLANCYYNQTYYGNAWMFNRISRTEAQDVNYPDEANYYSCHRARYYYEKALQYAKNKDYKALCSYMIAKCKAREAEHNYRRTHKNEYFYWDNEDYQKINGQVFAGFEKKYPDHYSEMMNNCEIFAYYYKQ